MALPYLPIYGEKLHTTLIPKVECLTQKFQDQYQRNRLHKQKFGPERIIPTGLALYTLHGNFITL